MVKTPLLATKLYTPSPRPNLVSRPQLIERLNAGLDRKLTLVSAPAGFGKTTVISEWVKALGGSVPPIAVSWLSLDESDNDLTSFLTYFIAALQNIEADLGKGALSALHSPQPPPAEGILTALINETVAISTRIILVLDDYHLIEDQAVHNALTFLLRRMPPSLHLVITTRVDPPLPLARLRARSQLTELRATDLRFTYAEAVEFLNQVMGLNLFAEDVAALERRTEGWIAGLQLAAVALLGSSSMQGSRDTSSFIQSFIGSHRYVLDYLIEEVLKQQSESIQTFLLQTSILNRLNASLCDAVRFGTAPSPNSSEGTAPTGQDSSQQVLEKLERANLFIVPLDNKRRWYRYHHLFADLLRHRLHQVQPTWVPVLHQRAIDWFEKNGFIDEAIEHALRAEDYDRAIDLIEDVAETQWTQARHAKLLHWLDRVPLELVYSRPQLCIFHAWILFATGKQDAAEQCLQAAEKALAPSTAGTTEPLPLEHRPQSSMDRMTLQGRIAVTRGAMAFFRGDVPGIIQHSRQAIEYLPKQDLWRSTAIITLGDAHFVKGEITEAYRVQMEAVEASKVIGNIYMILMTNLKLAITLRELGRLEQVIEICQQQMQFANENGLSQTTAVGWALAIWGEVLAELDDLDRAIHQAKKGVKLTRYGGDVGILGSSYLCLMRILFTSGDITRVEASIQEMENLARETFVPPWMMNLIATWQARVWLAQDNLKAGTRWMQERGLGVGIAPTLLYEMEYGIVSTRIFIAQGRLEEATSLLPCLLEVAEAGGRITRAIEILMLQALAHEAMDDTDQAIVVLERALTLAESKGYFRIFIDEGPSMAALLYEALTRGIAPEYVQRLLAAFPVTESEQAAPRKTQTPVSDLIEPLSERELEVLELFAQGLTNSEIASRLYLSPHTVKTHSSNIYSKLGVHRRTQAVARARALGILSPT